MSAQAETDLVTGGAGFIGSALVAQLISSGRRVVVLDNLVNGRRAHLEGLPHDRVRLVVGDVRDRPLVTSLLGEADRVFHLACLGVRHALHAPTENHDVNATATLGLLELAAHAGIRRFVHVSSSEVYGPAVRAPMDEDHPTRPTTVYGAAKLAGESYARALHATGRLQVVIVRPFNAYGPRCHHEGDAGEVVPKFVLRALAGRPLIVFGDGAQTRDFTYVEDTARGIALAGRVSAAAGTTINLGGGRETRIVDLAHMVATATGRLATTVLHEAARPGDVRRLCADARRAEVLLGWRPQVQLEAGLRRLIDWYGDQGVAPETLLAAEAVRNWCPEELARAG
jgi:UDP-glucose 4-epimerase